MIKLKFLKIKQRINGEKENDLDKLVLLELREKEFFLIFGTVPKEPRDNTRENIAQSLTFFLMGSRCHEGRNR